MRTIVNLEEAEMEIRADDAGEIAQLFKLVTGLKVVRLIVCGVPVGAVAIAHEVTQ